MLVTRKEKEGGAMVIAEVGGNSHRSQDPGWSDHMVEADCGFSTMKTSKITFYKPVMFIPLNRHYTHGRVKNKGKETKLLRILSQSQHQS